MFKKIQALQKVAQTVASPITQAANVIKTTFKPKPKKPNIGGTKKSDQIKKSNKMIKDLDKTMKKDMSPAMRARGEKLKKEIRAKFSG